MAEIKEVDKDISDEDIAAFEEADEAGDVKIDPDKLSEQPKETEETEVAETKEPEEEADVTTESSTVVKEEIKEVSGETPKERALRLEVTRLRRAAREKEQGNIFKGKEPVAEKDNAGYEKLKARGYNDEQIADLKEAVDVLATEQGYVKKDQTYKKMANDTLDSFIELHPEYSVENDKDDIYWGRFSSILKSDYNLAGKDSKQLMSVFNKIDRDVKEELGEKVSEKGKLEAQKQKIKSVSAGASTSSAKDTTKREVQTSGSKVFIASSHPNLVFKDFDEDEVREFTK